MKRLRFMDPNFTRMMQNEGPSRCLSERYSPDDSRRFKEPFPERLWSGSPNHLSKSTGKSS